MNDILRRTPLYEALKSRGGKMVPFAGYEMPVQFAGIKAEHGAVRNQVGLFDVSHMGEVWLTGPDALSAADYLVTNDIAGLTDGQIAYTPMCLPNGGIVDDLLVYRFGTDKILLVINAANHDKDVAHIRANTKGDVTVEDKSYDMGQLALQGPNASALMTALAGGKKFTDLEYFHFAQGEVAGTQCIVSRTGYTGEDGFELYCESQNLVALFEAITTSGGSFGLQQIGLGARDTLRLEAKLCLYGNDIDETTHPLEAGIGWTVKLDGVDFLGKEALVQRKAEGLTRKLVGFEMVDKGIARHGYPIVVQGAGPDAEPIGQVASGSPSPTLGTNIGLAYLPAGNTKRGTRFDVVIRGKVKGAKVVKTPFYKRGN